MTAADLALAISLALGVGILGAGTTAAQDAAPTAAAPARPPYTGEPLPAGAPKGEYQLSAWCYGAMSEYLDVYDKVKPSLRDIDKTFGSSSPNEKEPYGADMAAAREELKVLAGAVTAAEKASPNPIAAEGAEAVRQGRTIWALAEEKTNRELARAWLSWALPDKCDTTARQLATKSALLGQALQYNTGASTPDVAPAKPATPADAPPDAAPPSTDAPPAPDSPLPADPPAPTPN